MRPKNDDVRKAILAASTELFAREGYANTTMSRIAKTGGMSTSNLYVYYKSKLAIILEIYEPWMKEQIDALEERMAATDGTEAKIRRLVDGIVDEIPNDRGGYTRALVQALSVAVPAEEYDAKLLLWIEKRIAKILGTIAGFERADIDLGAVSYMMMLVFDGVGLRRDLPPRPEVNHAMKQALVTMLLASLAQR